MKDFFKIFFILTALFLSFIFGKNFGTDNYKNSEDYKKLLIELSDSTAIKNKIENLKIKIENIYTQSSYKKKDEIYNELYLVLKNELDLKNIEIESKLNQNQIINLNSKTNEKKSEYIKQSHEKFFDYNKLKSYEWILENSNNDDSLKRNLTNVEIKNLNLYLKKTKQASLSDIRRFSGSYRGRIFDINNKVYATISLDIKYSLNNSETESNLIFKIYKNEKEVAYKIIDILKSGFVTDVNSGLLIDNQNTFLHLYKIQNSSEIAGFYYEKLVQGTTNTIGRFILKRVDQF